MKKQTRIGLMVLVTLIITLALTIPGLADDPTLGECHLNFPADTPSGVFIDMMGVPGELTIEGDVQTTLENMCVGTVPFGESAHGNGKITFFTYKELASLDSFVVEHGYTYVDDETYTGSLAADVYDTDGTAYPVTDWYAKIYPNGAYEFYKEYTP